MDYEIVAFDMDGTLVEEPSSWRVIHRHFGTEGVASENLKLWERREIDYSEFMRRDIALWEPTPHISQIEKILKEFTLISGVSDTIPKIQEIGYEMAIISGGLDVLARRVGEKLGISHILANGLKVNKKGFLVGEGILRVDPCKKSDSLRRLVCNLGIDLDKCVGVSDSRYDVDLLKNVGMGVAIGNKGPLIEVADVVISDPANFDRLLDYL